MPKPTDEVEEKLEEKSNITETAEGGVEVSVAEETPSEVIHEEVKKVEKQQEKQPVKQDPLTNKVYAHDRILSNVQKSIEDLKNIMLANSNTNTITREQGEKLDELDELAQKDWKAAVRKLSEDTYKEIKTREQKEIEQVAEKQRVVDEMEENSQFVLSKHSELDDQTSEKYQIFQSILNNNPNWRTSPSGPLKTMYAMEDELRKRGYNVGNVTEKQELRPNVIPASSLPSSRPTTSGNKIVLTREQRDFCDTNGISYEDFARTLKNSGDKGGIAI